MSAEHVADTPLDVTGLRSRVDAALAGFLGSRAVRLAEISPELAPVAEAVRDLVLDGGKRLRPAFAYWGWRGAGGEDGEAIVAAAACLELVHACAIVHDDVMDASDTRRGRPSVHRSFEALHGARGWEGSAAGFGASAAILLGDLCLIWADELYRESGLDGAALGRGRPVYDEMRVEVMAGQYLDVLAQVAGDASLERAMTVARYKSAKYTIERPLHLGATLAGAGAELLAAYTAYGIPLGEAFQLRDDVLGVFGDPAQTGKPAGDDLREGKRTALVALAVQRGNDAQRSLLRERLGAPDLDVDGIQALRDVIRDTGALDEVEAMIAARTSQSLAALEESAVSPAARIALTGLAAAATRREV